MQIAKVFSIMCLVFSVESSFAMFFKLSKISPQFSFKRALHISALNNGSQKEYAIFQHPCANFCVSSSLPDILKRYKTAETALRIMALRKRQFEASALIARQQITRLAPRTLIGLEEHYNVVSKSKDAVDQLEEKLEQLVKDRALCSFTHIPLWGLSDYSLLSVPK